MATPKISFSDVLAFSPKHRKRSKTLANELSAQILQTKYYKRHRRSAPKAKKKSKKMKENKQQSSNKPKNT